MSVTPNAVTIDVVLTVQCGQSVVVPIGGKNVLVTASSASTPGTPPTPGTPTTSPNSGTTVPVKLPDIPPPVILPPSSVANIIEGLRGSVPVLQLDDFIRLSEPSELQTDLDREGVAGQLFDIEGIAGVMLSGRVVAEGDLDELGISDSVE